MRRKFLIGVILFLSLLFPVRACPQSLRDISGVAGPSGPDLPPAGLQGASRTAMTGTPDPATMTTLFPTAKPSLNLIDKSRYSLKLSLPSSWEPGPSGTYRESFSGGPFSAGLLASISLSALPARYGSWRLNTGFFFIRRDTSPLEPFPFLPDPDNIQGVGTVNISITY